MNADFVFVGDIGRPDLLGEEARKELAHQLYQSVFGTLRPLPDFTEIFPGHGAGSLCGKAIGSRSSSTLGYERRFNAALVEKPEKEWIGDLMDQMPLSPPYFARMKRVNKEGPKVIGSELPGQRRWSAKEVHEQACENCLVVDVRSKEAFAAAHTPRCDQHSFRSDAANVDRLGAALRSANVCSPKLANCPGFNLATQPIAAFAETRYLLLERLTRITTTAVCFFHDKHD
jgi:hydroxyacylglutathione hydrolase